MPKIVFVGRMGWLVANTKTKKKNFEKKLSIKGSKNAKKKNSHIPKEHISKKN